MPEPNARNIAVALLGVLTLALVLAAAALLARNDDPAPIQVLPPPATGTADDASGPFGEARVHVAGAVASPGVYTMNQDSRVIDAIAAAGGETDGADLAGINLARRVRDEEQYYIPVHGERQPLTLDSVGSSGNQTNAEGLIDLNTASIDQLQALPGIGPVLAGAIVEYRQGSGPFQTVDDIVNVPRIGPATLERIRGLVTTLASR